MSTAQLLAELQQAHAAIEALRQVTTQHQVDMACEWLREQGLTPTLDGKRLEVIEEAGGTIPQFKPMFLRGRTWHDDKKD